VEGAKFDLLLFQTVKGGEKKRETRGKGFPYSAESEERGTGPSPQEERSERGRE